MPSAAPSPRPARRRLVLGAKAVLIAAYGLVFGLLSAFLVFFIAQPIDRHYGFALSFSEHGVLRAVIGGGLYIAASGVLGFALGALLRRTAGAIVAAVAGLLVVPGLTNLLPGAWGQVVQRYFTSNAGQQIAYTVQQSKSLGPWSGYLAYTVWWVVLLALAAFFVQRRDA